ncbi:hypothetical protein HOE22_05380 [Candidatus Woesearchaeota archaeon]|jgi:hypothetical protein|nr:hypothetical protein [Candidatus Woesearchaeota archaeon]MBT7556576.1 hypothetical protein [Candidatus Woesearchaeota archaeon]
MIKFTEQTIRLLETVDRDLKLLLKRTDKRLLWSQFILNLEVLHIYVLKNHLTEKKNGR